MHTYRKSKDEPLWTVGVWEPHDQEEVAFRYWWHPIKDFSTEKMAAAFANYLNGGAGIPWEGHLG